MHPDCAESPAKPCSEFTRRHPVAGAGNKMPSGGLSGNRVALHAYWRMQCALCDTGMVAASSGTRLRHRFIPAR
jgi:hypothetical protein